MTVGLSNTALLDLPLPVEGYFDGTWGDLVNNALTNYLDIAIAGTLVLTGDSPVTLDNTAGDDSASNISSTSAQYAVVKITTTTTTKTITVGTAGSPAVSKIYIVDNAGAGGTVTFKAYGQTGISVAVGEKCVVYFNGTDFVKVASSVADGVTSVSGTGTVNGITLTGTVTSTGSLTLGGTLANVNLTSQVTGTLPIANGGTGTTSTTFANLTTNVTGTLPVANGGTGVTTSTGTGNVVLSTAPTLTSPVLVTPVLGTPASGNFSSGTFTWPTFNQNTSGTAAGLSSTLAVASGGTGVTTSTGTGNVVLSASPTFTGIPAAPTASNGTNTTQLATTAFVLNQIGAISAGVTSFSAGTTGLTPSTGTSGNVTLAGTLAVANGGTGTSTPALVQGTGITVSGTWPNQTITATNAGSVTSVTGTAPVVSSGGATPAISMAAATASVNGYMTSTYAAKLDGIAAGATNVTNTNQLTNGAGFITGSGNTTGSAGSLVTTNFSVVESGGKLLFKYGATTIASMTSAGVFTTISDITGNGTP
jgi:hypothetical protein